VNDHRDALKRAAALRAVAEVENGMVVGLGTGSTARFAIERLGERVRGEGLRIRGIPTSLASERLARACGVPLVSFEEVTRLDLAIDGADEVDPAFHMIKGGGGALLREKVVARRSRLMVVVVDPSKLVACLGAARQRLPVEVVPFAHRPVAEELIALGGEPVRRELAGRPFVTDNGNWILDVGFAAGIADPAGLEQAIDRIPGVVESGLFVHLLDRLVIGRPGTPEVREPVRG
jgi:ribose 5-phosphate isomerase A